MFSAHHRSPLDPDALAFCAANGATDIRGLSDFARGTKNMGLWPHMVYWPLRSSQSVGTGTSAPSFGGLGTHDGSLVNGPTWGATGMAFDGTSYISAGAIDLPTDFSISFWINHSGINAVWHEVLNFGFINLMFTDSASMHVNNNIEDHPASVFSVSASTWHFVCITKTATNLIIYVDGVSVVDIAPQDYTIPSDIYIGGFPVTSNLVGTLAACGFWNSALTATQATYLYQLGTGAGVLP